MLGHVHHPQPVWSVGIELAVHEIVTQLAVTSAGATLLLAAVVQADHAVFSHDSLDAPVRDRHLQSVAQLSAHTRGPVRTA